MNPADNCNGIGDVQSHKIAVISDIEDLCDASTVVNISLQKKGEELIEKECDGVKEVLSVNQNIRVQKVAAWLNHSQFDCLSDTNGDLDWWETRSGKNETLPLTDISDVISFGPKRVRVFLLSVYPYLEKPLDLVSGLCHTGCQGYTKFSEIHWLQNINDNEDVPVCPRCQQTEEKKELLLMFVVKLHVMDQRGVLKVLNLYREKAEYFFDCSLEDYIKSQDLREKIVKQLQEFVVERSKSFVPLMDLSVILVNKIYYFVHQSKIKLPTCKKEG